MKIFQRCTAVASAILLHPTIARSVFETQTVCSDDVKWRYDGKKKKHCNWVRKKVKKRCKFTNNENVKAKLACPIACNNTKNCIMPKCKTNTEWIRKKKINCSDVTTEKACGYIGSGKEAFAGTKSFGYEACHQCGYCNTLKIIQKSAEVWEASRVFTIEGTQQVIECSLDDNPYYECSSNDESNDHLVYILAASVGAHTLRVRQVSNPHNTDLVDFTVETVFQDGVPTITTHSEDPIVHNQGAFRMACGTSHTNNDDAIIHPNVLGASHQHTYFSNNETDAYSTTETLMTSGVSNCQGGRLNGSGYWVPTIWSSELQEPIKPSRSVNVYYKEMKPNPNLQPMPTGLRMILGDSSATDPQSVIAGNVRFQCTSCKSSVTYNTKLQKRSSTFISCCFYYLFHNTIGKAMDDPPTGNPYAWVTHIPRCAIGDTIEFKVHFPFCWDGTNLDSANHKSHMSYYTQGACPDSHPVELPIITYILKFDVTSANAGVEGDSRHWRLSSDNYNIDPDTKPGGYSIHADWFMAWHPEVMEAFTTHCIKAGNSCANGVLGNGWRLFGDFEGDFP